MVNKVQELFYSFMIPSIHESMNEMINESTKKNFENKLFTEKLFYVIQRDLYKMLHLYSRVLFINFIFYGTKILFLKITNAIN